VCGIDLMPKIRKYYKQANKRVMNTLLKIVEIVKIRNLNPNFWTRFKVKKSKFAE
jgi:hypothetical protein